MKHAKLFSILVFSITAVYGAIGFWFLPLAGFQSELTRMAMLPETMFGWTKPQPAIGPAFMQQSSWQDADVLVVGDSFSADRVWQTALTKAGLKVRSESWASVREICEDFMPWLRGRGFNGKYVVFESIERSISDLAERSVACRRMQFHSSVHADTPRRPPISSFDPGRRDYSGKLSVAIQTKIRETGYLRRQKSPDFSVWNLPNHVKLARVDRGCELFSHAECNNVLFLADDSADELPASTLDNIEKLNARLSGITPIWLFVPNKSTAYLYPDKQFWNEAERRLGAPNVLRAVRQAIGQNTVDLYPANNTHFSTTGYLLLGDIVLKQLKIQPLIKAENAPGQD